MYQQYLSELIATYVWTELQRRERVVADTAVFTRKAGSDYVRAESTQSGYVVLTHWAELVDVVDDMLEYGDMPTPNWLTA